MTTNQPAGTPVQSPLADLFARYLQNQLAAQTAGFAPSDTGEVLPHEAGPVQAVDPRLAWDGAVAILGFYPSVDKAKTLPRPADWASLAAIHEPAAGVAFAAGNFPQMVRAFQPLLQARDLAALRPGNAQPLHAPALREWAARDHSVPRALLALGVLRLARQFDAAADLLGKLQVNVPALWQAALANEAAAVAWHAGRAEEAVHRWQTQPESVPVLFNRGMAALFSDRPAEARSALAKAVPAIPEDSAWHHLGRLYLALAETRS